MGNDCLVSVDGTDFKIAEYGPPFSSHKFAKKSGLQYEICLCILTRDIVWVHGPFPCRKYPDIKIFQTSLKSHLGEYKRVEADDGYIGDALRHVKCPKSIANPLDTEYMQNVVQGRQETVNKRFKDWGLLRQLFRHADCLPQHGNVFCAIACLSQLQIDGGMKLLSVEYKDLPCTNTAFDVEDEDEET